MYIYNMLHDCSIRLIFRSQNSVDSSFAGIDVQVFHPENVAFPVILSKSHSPIATQHDLQRCQKKYVFSIKLFHTKTQFYLHETDLSICVIHSPPIRPPAKIEVSDIRPQMQWSLNSNKLYSSKSFVWPSLISSCFLNFDLWKWRN